MMEVLRRWCRAIHSWLLGYHICPMLEVMNVERIDVHVDPTNGMVYILLRSGQTIRSMHMDYRSAKTFSEYFREELEGNHPTN